MALKKYFNGTRLIEVEVPDQPLPDVLATNAGDNPFISPLNPQGADPALLPVDVAALPNLRPTDGAVSSQKFHDPLPGNGEGAGVGQKSGAVLRDVWLNDPNRDTGLVESVQSGGIGDALSGSEAKSAAITADRLADAWSADRPSAVDAQRAQRDADFNRRNGITVPVGQVGEILLAAVPEAEFAPPSPTEPATPVDTAPDFADKEVFPNKEALRSYIGENGGEDPHAQATREELETAAREAYDRKQLA